MTTAAATGRTFVRAKRRETPDLPHDQMEFVASTEMVAADGLVIRRQAWDRTLARAKETGWFPRFLAGHSHHSPDGGPPTIGKILRMAWEDKVGLVIRVQFAPADVNPLGPRYLKAYRDAYMSDVSVSWGETRFAPETEWANRDVPEIVDLLSDEVSAVSIGSDFGAKKRLKDAGLDDLVPPETRDATADALAATKARRACAPCAPTAADLRGDDTNNLVPSHEESTSTRTIVKDHPDCGDGKYALVSKDDEKVLGCHDSEDEAKAQEAAIKAKEHSDDDHAKSAAATRGLTAVDVWARAKARAHAPAVAGQRARHYESYVTKDGLWTPVAGQGAEALDAVAYRAVWHNWDVAFQEFTPNTDDLIALPDAPADAVCREIDDFWNQRDVYAKLGFLHKRGVLLYGPPGSGKTTTVHQVTRMMVDRGAVVVAANSPSLLGAALAALRDVEPEREVVAVLEDTDRAMHHDEHTMLDLLDGPLSRDHVLVLGTTNYLHHFSPRLLRAGRFDRKVEVPMPCAALRRAYLARKLAALAEDAEIDRLATRTEGCSFGDLRELVLSVYALGEPVEDALRRLVPDADHASARAEAPLAATRAMVGHAAAERTQPIHVTLDLSAVVAEITAAAQSVREACQHLDATAQRMEEHAARMAGASATDASDDATPRAKPATTPNESDIGTAALAGLRRTLEEGVADLAMTARAATGNGAMARRPATEA